ncbi:hypothetical protein BJF83_08985 [Nocardiopsis sp. CNR-923]|nr:hypothetical protein BJF83_08985 [Nocardiopsis sp. CNR-923]
MAVGADEGEDLAEVTAQGGAGGGGGQVCRLGVEQDDAAARVGDHDPVGEVVGVEGRSSGPAGDAVDVPQVGGAGVRRTRGTNARIVRILRFMGNVGDWFGPSPGVPRGVPGPVA